MSKEAERILEDLQRKNFSRKSLAAMYINMALNEGASGLLDRSAIISYLEVATKLDPNNELAELYKALFLALVNNKEEYKAAQQDLDPDFIKNIAVENNLLRHETPNDELNIEDYDVIKLHRYFQRQKQQELEQLNDSIIEPYTVKPEWVVENVSYDGKNSNIVSLESQLYPNHYAIIHPKLKLEPTILNRFQLALQKGLCKRSIHQNGIKFLDGCVIELKIDDDARLYTNKIYKNNTGQSLIIFDTVGNHRSVKTLLQNKKRISIIELMPLKKVADKILSGPHHFFQQSETLRKSRTDKREFPEVATSSRPGKEESVHFSNTTRLNKN